MDEFKQYKRTQIAEMRPFSPDVDMRHVSVSVRDRENGSPKVGDMIARNPKDHADQWLVSAQYFRDNFEAPAATNMDELQGKLASAIYSGSRDASAAARIIREMIEHKSQPVETDYRDRLKTEATELSGKLKKLNAFIDAGPTFRSLPLADRHLLRAQQAHMTSYLAVLRERITRS